MTENGKQILKNDIDTIKKMIIDKYGYIPNNVKDIDFNMFSNIKLDDYIKKHIYHIVSLMVKGIINSNKIITKVSKYSDDVESKEEKFEGLTIDGDVETENIIENQAIITEKKNASLNTKTGETEIVDRGQPTTIEVEAKEKKETEKIESKEVEEKSYWIRENNEEEKSSEEKETENLDDFNDDEILVKLLEIISECIENKSPNKSKEADKPKDEYPKGIFGATMRMAQFASKNFR